jgi:dethiobiotin synthetase
MRGFVVTGTDTGIGKTVLAAGLVARLGARYWKPVQSGWKRKPTARRLRVSFPALWFIPKRTA